MKDKELTSRETVLQDLRWERYRNIFHTLPLFCFNDLKFPDSYEEALSMISVLELEQQNIAKQFVERDAELESMSERERLELQQEHNSWRTRALRAQRLKFNQVRVLQAWMLDNPLSHEERIRVLEERTKELEAKLTSQRPN